MLVGIVLVTALVAVLEAQLVLPSMPTLGWVVAGFDLFLQWMRLTLRFRL